MDVAALVSEYGAHYIDEGQNMQRLTRQLYYGNSFDELFTIVRTDNTTYRGASSLVTRLAQPFQQDWTPLGDVEFVPAPIETYGIKMDVDVNPDELVKTWMGWATSNDHDRAEWPFIRWLLEVHLVPKFTEDIMLNEAYNGEFAAVTPGTAGAAGTAMDGLKKIINDWITAGRISPFTIGAWSADPETFVTQLEDDFIGAIEEKYQRQTMTLVMNVSLYNRFRAGQLAKYNKHYEQASTERFMLFPNITVVGEPALGSSEKVWCTPKENQILAWKYGEKGADFGIESRHRTVSIFTDFYKGYGFLIPEIVFTNNLDLAV